MNDNHHSPNFFYSCRQTDSHRGMNMWKMKGVQCLSCIGLCLWISPGQIRSWSSKHRCKYQTHQAHTHQGLLWRTLMQKTVQTRMQLSLFWLGKSLAFWNMHRAWTRCRLYVCALPCLDLQIAPCMHASDCWWQNCICTPTASLQVELTTCISCSMLARFWTFINHPPWILQLS